MNLIQQRVHRSVTVAALIVGPLSLIVATVLQWLVSPAGMMWSVVGLISVFGPLCWLAGIPAVIDLVHGRGWALTTIGGYVTAVGLAAAVGHLAIFFALDGPGEARPGESSSDGALSTALLLLFLVCFCLGPILLSVGLRRAKRVAVWVPVAAIVMAVASFVGGVPAGIVQLCALVLTFAPMIGAVVRDSNASRARGASVAAVNVS